jgi:hypothetical protein
MPRKMPSGKASNSSEGVADIVERVTFCREVSGFCVLSASYCRSTLDEEANAELPADLETSDRFVPLPNGSDLGLGRRLALSFTAQELAADYDTVQAGAAICRSCFHAPRRQTAAPPLSAGRRTANGRRDRSPDRGRGSPGHATRPSAARSDKARGQGFAGISDPPCPTRCNDAPSRAKSAGPCH